MVSARWSTYRPEVAPRLRRSGLVTVPTTVPIPRADHPARARSLGPLRAVAATAARVQAWAEATDARRRTERVLHPLRDAGWDVAHDVRLPGVDRIDHLAAGPSGVYLLASKAWQGAVTVDHKGATITPGHDHGSAWTAHGPHRSLPPAAAAVVHALATATGRSFPAPRAVVVVWAPFAERVTVCGGISYVAGEHLVDWLVGQPARLEPLGPGDLPRPRESLRAAPRSPLRVARPGTPGPVDA